MNNDIQKQKRQRRVRSKIIGTKDMPRLSVFRSNAFVYAQMIDDENGKTLFGVAENKVENIKGNKSEKAKQLGMQLAKLAHEKKIKKTVFDRGRYRYHGRVKALAEGARAGGLEF